MALPPKGDVRRPLLLAVRSMRLLGIFLIVLGLLGTLALFLTPVAIPAGGATAAVSWFEVFAIAFYLVPGIGYFLCAMYLKQRRSWAVVAGIVICGVYTGLVLVALVASMIGIASMRQPDPAAWAIVMFCVLLLAALVQTIVYLAKSFRSIREWPGDEQRGFELLGVTSSPPVPPPGQMPR